MMTKSVLESGLNEMMPTIVHDDPSMENKLLWLRSNIIGGNAEFSSPFGQRRITYADTTASGRSLRYIEDYIVSHVLPFYGNTHTSDSYVGYRSTRMVYEASQYIKKCLGGTTNDALLFCGSGTTAAIKRLQEGMGIAIPSILSDRAARLLREEERWVVFVGPYEHHSNLLSWRKSLAEVVEIGIDEYGLVDMEELRGELERYKDTNRPMLGSFSACSNVTGIFSYTRAIARLLHEYGAFACFDFAASGPYVEIDMRSGEVGGYDAIFLSPHKFIGGPGCPGVLLMNKQLYQLQFSAPSTCGGGTVSYVNGFNEEDTLYFEDIEERENAGTPPIIQTIRASLSFWVKEYIGYKTIEEQEEANIQKALKRFGRNKNIRILGNMSAKRQAILSFLVYPTKRGKPLHGPFVAKLLNDLFG
ncbi:putative cysteine desulfurase, partial [Drosera capensis]